MFFFQFQICNMATRNGAETEKHSDKQSESESPIVIPSDGNTAEDHRHEKFEYLLYYGVDDVPPWYTCFLLGFQVKVKMFKYVVRILVVTPYKITQTKGLVDRI